MKVSPSILTADYLTLSKELEILEKSKTDMLHLDVMDGNFVPNISFGIPVIKSIAKHTSLPLDIHLMIDRPHRYIAEFAKYADYLNIHYEAGSEIEPTLMEIRKLNCRPAITIKPASEPEEIFKYLSLVDMVLVMSVEPGFGGQSFLPSALVKLKKLSEEAKRQNLNIELEVDGGINAETAAECAAAGATILVAGSYIFNSPNIEDTVASLKSL